MQRLILFDIDGTLVSGGPAKTAFVTALAETYGTAGSPDTISFAGKTDPQIARELLTQAGLTRDAIDEAMPELWERYLGHLEPALGSQPVRVLPGVPELLDQLAALDGIALGLVTGNIAGGAQLKLRSAGLWGHFGIGGYGSDHEERDELPSIALGRARAHWTPSLGPEHAIVVGDTPRDVACGRAGGMRTLAVATGQFSAQDLQAAGADHVLADFTATVQVVALLTGRPTD